MANSYLRLHHRWTLSTQYPCCLENINNPLILHPFQNYTKCNEYTCSSHAGTKNPISLTLTQNKIYKNSPAMHCNGTILPKLLLCFVHLSNKINESIARLRNTLFRPIGELELSYRPWRTIPGIGNFKFTKNILRHVVFRNWINYETLITHWAITWPVLMTLFLLWI